MNTSSRSGTPSYSVELIGPDIRLFLPLRTPEDVALLEMAINKIRHRVAQEYAAEQTVVGLPESRDENAG